MNPMNKTVTLNDEERRHAEVLATAMRLLDASDQTVADAFGWDRRLIQHRRTGRTRIRPGEPDVLAQALDVPVDLFDMEPREAAKWLVDNRDDVAIKLFAWIPVAA